MALSNCLVLYGGWWKAKLLLGRAPPRRGNWETGDRIRKDHRFDPWERVDRRTEKLPSKKGKEDQVGSFSRKSISPHNFLGKRIQMVTIFRKKWNLS